MQVVWMTPRAAVLFDPDPGWAPTLMASLLPGSHAFVISKEPDTGIEGRRSDFELRDTILILSSGPKARYGFLLRKPIAEDTATDQIVRTGTGCINVQAARVAADMSEFFSATGKPRSGLGHANAYGMGEGYGGDRANPPNEAGRWPPNVLLIHGPECRKVGTKRVAASSGVPKSSPITATRRSGVHSDAGGHQAVGRVQPVFGYGDDDGTEQVDAWKCEQLCPVILLDKQTGDRPSTLAGRADPSKTHENPGDNHGESLFGGGNSKVYADSGGASRYYPQFEDEDAMMAWMRRLLEPPT